MSTRAKAICVTLLLLCVHEVTSRASGGARGGSAGRSSSSFSRPSTSSSSSFSKPAATPTAYRPTTPTTSSAAAATAAASRARLGYSSYRYMPLILPFALGGLAGASLSRGSSYYCNGIGIVCYREACEQGVSQCLNSQPFAQAPLDVNGTNLTVAVNSSGSPFLQLTDCPSSDFGECYKAEQGDVVFLCNGRRRPSSSSRSEAIDAQCGQVVADGTSSSRQSSMPKVVLAVSMAVGAAAAAHVLL